MSKHDRDDFRGFCEQATDRQLINIIEKEKEAAKGDPDREVYAGIAEAVQAGRNQR